MCSAPWYSNTRRRSRSAREQQHVAEEQRGPHHPLDQPEQHRGVQLILDQARQPDRDQEEQHDRERERHHDRSDPDRLRDLLRLCLPGAPPSSSAASPPAAVSSGGSWAFAETSSARKPIASEPPSATTPRMIGRRSTRWRFIAESSGIASSTSISPSAASSGERSPSAAARRSACAPPPPSWRRRASSRPRAPPARRPARRAARLQLAVAVLGDQRGSASASLPPREARRPLPSLAAAARSREPAAGRADIRLLGGPGLSQATLGDAALEALDASAGVHQLLPARVERVAVRAHLDVQLVARGAGDELVAACAANVGGARTWGGSRSSSSR